VIEELLLMNFVEADMLSSFCGFVQAAYESRFDTGFWTIECSRHHINGDRDIVAQFCNICQECNLLVSQVKSSKIWLSL
jgi:hypothetical protein